MMKRILLSAVFVALAAGPALAQDTFVPHDRDRGELSPGTGAPTTDQMLRAAEGGGTTSSLIATLEYGERVECHACVAPLTRALLESRDPEVRRISAWWLRRRLFAIGAICAFALNLDLGQVLDDLVVALREKEIAGAGLDVFEIEPLPPGHRLWKAPNFLMTPHIAAAGPHLEQRRLDLIIDNCRRLARGEELVNIVDKANWF